MRCAFDNCVRVACDEMFDLTSDRRAEEGGGDWEPDRRRGPPASRRCYRYYAGCGVGELNGTKYPVTRKYIVSAIPLPVASATPRTGFSTTNRVYGPIPVSLPSTQRRKVYLYDPRRNELGPAPRRATNRLGVAGLRDARVRQSRTATLQQRPIQVGVHSRELTTRAAEKSQQDF